MCKSESTLMNAREISHTFDPEDVDHSTADSIVIIGKKSVLKDIHESKERDIGTLLGVQPGESFSDAGVISAMLRDVKAGPSGGSTSAYLKRPIQKAEDAADDYLKLSLCVLPAEVSRNNHEMSPHVLTDLLKSSKLENGNMIVYILGASTENVGALSSAIAKALPLFSRKTTGKSDIDLKINVCFLDSKSNRVSIEEGSAADYIASADAVAEGVSLASRLVDMPPNHLTTDKFATECRDIAECLSNCVTFDEIVGEELKEKGYGGVYHVGKAAECPPRLIIMNYTPPSLDGKGLDDLESVALVGKGIVYDTGGLALKTKTGMCGMKHDMGGSAGVLGGFYAAVKLGLQKKITLTLCLAENAIGSGSFRNDDILRLYSGKTCEINNTDAEGRLVLADGVAHVSKHVENLDLIVDMATLTGAQLIATGKKHAGVLANTRSAEQRVFDAGLKSGDLTYPLLYAPELLKKEFASKVADMKNSVKDRGNAQSSCAGHFIEAHIDANFKGEWIHVDMAGPCTKDERGTGYGVALVLSILNAPGF